ncbi:signal recognition particle receptor subunit alpha [Nematocida homosporus]|uniref:signal recognition particle receptor subunit alpha n=1 Tax=Nematocida homosporus TaxID=1912981 RepID=UPI00221F1B51|nr:signal recognition particle receptor subunit alpha [Nematocida homosporus]KAI5185900.1 signal recognition particle receptor subunit alpha [Nematocida homosporus]
MQKHKLVFGVVFSRGGIIRCEFGKEPVYLKQFIERMPLSSTVGTIQVRDESVSYVSGVKNVYLVVYKNREIEREVVDVLERTKEEMESSKDGRIPAGIFKDEDSIGNGRDSIGNGRDSIGVSRDSIGNSSIMRNSREEKVDEDSDPEEESPGWAQWSRPRRLMEYWSGKQVSERDLRDHLLGRNVPMNLSQKIAKETLEFAKDDISDLTEKDKIRKGLKKTLAQLVPILSPESIISEISQRKQSGKGPYVFCLVGVNGVGKSTTLSKLCLWLLKNNFRVCVAACDGFRSGAIEQLRKYVDRYKTRGHAISLFERGYGKDESNIANQAIRFGNENNFDVVLIDTCGRMPSNQSSMTSLSKMIRVNRPNKVLYIGEALVGSDSIEQVRTFNAYVEKASVGKAIDGIVVTKCDTVDEKVGTIISLAHTVHRPVVFIGVGQKNVDLLPFSLDGLCTALYM